MQEKERKRVLSRHFTWWLLSFGKLQDQSETFKIPDVNEETRVMSVTVNGKEILLTLASESNTLTWMPGGDEAVNLRELSGNGWTYFEDIGPLSFHRYEALISPNVDGGKELFRFTFGRHLDKGDTFVSQTIEAKPSI